MSCSLCTARQTATSGGFFAVYLRRLFHLLAAPSVAFSTIPDSPLGMDLTKYSSSSSVNRSESLEPRSDSESELASPTLMKVSLFLEASSLFSER